MTAFTHRSAYRYGLALAIATALLLAWLSLGVGIIGQDGDRANILYFGVIAIGVIGAFLGRFSPRAMAIALFATAGAQALVAAVALAAGLGLPYSPPAEIVLLNAFFVAMFCAAAWLFRRAASRRGNA
ncbi:MAG TPA: hypothetical protein VNB23_13500 [Ramlibacter sp.]|nr:hypothetical protein [Ramlibacter sp.]